MQENVALEEYYRRAAEVGQYILNSAGKTTGITLADGLEEALTLGRLETAGSGENLPKDGTLLLRMGIGPNGLPEALLTPLGVLPVANGSISQPTEAEDAGHVRKLFLTRLTAALGLREVTPEVVREGKGAVYAVTKGPDGKEFTPQAGFETQVPEGITFKEIMPDIKRVREDVEKYATHATGRGTAALV